MYWDPTYKLKLSTKEAILQLMASFAFFCFFACEENLQTENNSTKNDSIVSTRLFNAKYTLKDSGYVKIKLTSPIVEMYELIDTPQTIFPKGLELNFYKIGQDKPGYLRASYAKIVEKRGWYEASGNVKVINTDGDTLKTNHLFWNKKTQKIYTPDSTVIIRADGTINYSDHGLEATDDFKNYRLNQNRGSIFVKD